MKREETRNLSREELFEKIKRKCISRSRVSFYVGLVILILIIALFIYHVRNSFDDTNRLNAMFFIVFACMAGWLVLYNYWYQKKVKKIDDPSQLLHYFEKKNRSLTIFCLAGWLVWLGVKFVDFFRAPKPDFENVLLTIALIASVFLIFVTNKPGTVSFKDMEIIEQLQDLIDKE